MKNICMLTFETFETGIMLCFSHSTLISASHSLLSGSSLSESQQLRLEAVTFICHWCSYERPPSAAVSVQCERDVRYTQTKIIKLLEDGVFDPSRAADLQLVRTVKPDLSSHSKIDKTKIFMTWLLNEGRKYCRMLPWACRISHCNTFDLD